ncbi:MAG: glycosyltransferase family 39 protein [Roseiflexaceae bacterium]
MAKLLALRHNPRFWLGLIVLVGLLLRLWFIAINPLDPRFSNADDGDYYRRALRLAVTGLYLDDSWLIRPPFHVFFFAAWLRVALVLGITQYGILLVQLAQTAVAALTVLVGYAAAARIFRNQLAGLLFAAFLSLWYSFVEQPMVLFSELLYLALFLVHVWLLARFDQDTPTARRDLFLSGIALGMAALTRSPALYSLAFVGGWLFLRQWRVAGAPPGWLAKFGSSFRQGLIITAGCLLIVLPWTARNYLVYQKLIPVDTLGQINLWLDLDRVSDRNRNIDTLRGLPQAERASYAMEQARELLAADPLKPFDGMWPTFQHIWKAQFVEDYFIKQSFFTRPLRETAWLGLSGDLLWLLFTLAGLLGLASPVREGWHWRLFCWGWLAYSFLTVLVFHVEPRYLLPIWTLIGLYGAGWLGHLWEKKAGSVRSDPPEQVGLAVRIQQALLAVAFVLLLVSYRNYPQIIAVGLAREQGYTAAEQAYHRGDYPAAEAGFRQALAAQPTFVDAEVGLALALGAQGRYEEGLAAIRRDASRRSELAYGGLLRDSGQPEAASAQLLEYEAIAGEDVQRWALEWFRPPATRVVPIGTGIDLGYIEGFLEAEQAPGGSYRWLAGSGAIHLTLPEPITEGASVLLRLTSGRAEPTELRVRIGSGPEQRVIVQGGQWRSYRLAVPVEQVGSRQLTITLQAPTFVPARENPASDDARTLSLMVAEVRVQ